MSWNRQQSLTGLGFTGFSKRYTCPTAFSMTIEIEVDNEEQAEEMVQAAYKKGEYILDAEHFNGVDFTTREKKWILGTRNNVTAGRSDDLRLFLFGW